MYPPACSGGLTPREHRLEAGGMAWRTLEWGERGPPLALWHGIRGTAAEWWRTGPLLAGIGYHVWAPDLPGHGSSDDAPDGYALDATAALLDAWLAELELYDPVVVGHSWGAINALAHALLPETCVRPRGVVLVDPPLRFARDAERYIPEYLDGVGDPATEETVAAFQATPGWHPCDAVFKAQALELARRTAIDAFFRANAGLDRVDDLAQLAAPGLLILGDPGFGGLWSADAVAETRRVAPALAIEVLVEASHSPYRDAFVPFSVALGGFVKRFL